MKRPILIGAAAAACAAALAGFWLARKSRAALEPGVLAAGMDALAAGWESQNIPAAERVVNIVICDAQAGGMARKAGGGAAGAQSVLDGEILPVADGKSPLVWFRRTFLRRTASADKPGALAESLGSVPNAVSWTHRGFETAGQEEMVREVTRALIKAADAGAEANIVTQGAAAAPVLKALKRLEKAERGGKTAAVNKFMALDMNRATLRKIDSGYFAKIKRPGNLKEWLNVWRAPLPPHRVTIELFGQDRSGARFYADEIFREMGLQFAAPSEPGATAAEPTVLKFVRVLLKRVYVIEKVMDQLAQAAKARAEREKAAAAAQPPGRPPEQGAPIEAGRPAPSRPSDSLSAIRAGWLKQEKTEVIRRANWYGAVKYCEKDGGRLPTVNELKSMRNAECEAGRQSNTCGEWFWSSEEESACCAWGVDFQTGTESRNTRRNDANAVRCVGGAEARSACGRGTCSWHEAVDYCKARGGLPGVEQLKEIHQAECLGIGRVGTCDKYYWSSEEVGPSRAQFVNFAAGSAHYGNKSNRRYYRARCVR